MGLEKLLKKESQPAEPVQETPDFRKMWEQYAGELDNVNRINEGELAAVRARLTAAGASPDSLMTQSEHLESQRKSQVAKLQDAPKFKALMDEYKSKKPKEPFEEYFKKLPFKPEKKSWWKN